MTTYQETTRSTQSPDDQRTGDRAASGQRESGCTECDSDAIVTSEDTGERICEDCGLVLEEDALDHGPEWQAYTQEEQRERSRVGRPTTLTIHDKGLTTEIDWQNVDAGGQQLDAQGRKRAQRLRTWQTRIRTQNQNERNLQHALGELHRMASALGIPYDVREIAAAIYRRALDAGMLPGRSIEGIATGALYIACRQKQIPRSLSEFVEVSRVERREIARAERYLVRELDLDVLPADPATYLPRFCSDLDVPPEVQRSAREIVDATTDVGLHSGKSPPGFAAAAIYLAAGFHDVDLTQQEVADAAGVTEVTIRNRYREQMDAVSEQSIGE
jgi:transcription initiation factor TFIIB